MRMVSYRPGTPCWVDLWSPDVDASVIFYRDLFGWDAGAAERSGGYRTFLVRGKLVAGIALVEDEQVAPQWTTYISTEDGIETVRRVEAEGGSVLSMRDMEEGGGIILLRDATGAMFGVFRLGRHRGAEGFNEPGSLTFNQLTTDSPAVGKRFYSRVFGWDPRDRVMGGGFAFTYFFQEKRAVAGLMPGPPGSVSHWLVYFAVEDADATAARIVELGGGVVQPTTDTPFGRMVVLKDPHGAGFAAIRHTPEVRAAARKPTGVLPELHLSERTPGGAESRAAHGDVSVPTCERTWEGRDQEKGRDT